MPPDDAAPGLAPLVFIAHRLDDGLRFCLRQAQYVDASRPLLLVTDDAATPPEGVTVLTPTQLHLPGLSPDLTSRYILAALAACCRHFKAGTCWYLAPHTLLFDPLAWPEGALAEADIAAAQASDGTLLALYAKASSLHSLLSILGDMPPLDQAADALNLFYEPLAEVRSGHTFCTGLADTQGFRPAEGSRLKHIVWVQGQPFFVSTQTGLVARAITLHLPGALAGRLHRYYTGPGMMLQKLKAEGKLLF